ncbi:MAG: hypothetical protein HY017_24445 [Betaproteobacteria bacterium]|nr:hypothetical protein [Betaproteobacteria bacterium]
MTRAVHEAIVAELREDVTRYVLRLAVLVGAAMLAASLARAHSTGLQVVHVAGPGVYALFVAGYLLRRRLAPRLQLALIIGGSYAAGMIGLTSFGLLGSGVPMLLAFCALTALLLGAAPGWSALACGMISMAGAWLGWRSGWLGAGFNAGAYFGQVVNWITSLVIFVGVATIVIAAVGRMTGQLIASAGAEADAAGQLAVELAERERADEALREAEARFAIAFRASPDAIAIYRDIEVPEKVEANAAFDRLVGSSVLPAEWIDALRRSSGFNDQAYTLERPGGGRVEVLCSAVLFGAGAEQFVLIILVDVSDERAAERELERLNFELEAVVSERTAALRAAILELEAFTYAAAHNLRTPLRALNAFAQLIGEEAGATLAPELASSAARIRRRALAMGEMLDGLLELSRINRRELRREDVDLSALAEEALAQLRAAAPGREVEAVIEPGMTVEADSALMRLVLTNLIENAWKFTAHSTRPRIEFGARREASGTAYFVRDNGAGFDMAGAARLFEPFERLHPAQEFEGAATGLATVARAIRRQGGRVWAQAIPGQGASFWFALGDP